MADFPTVYADSISFSHGEPQVSEYQTFGIGPVRFRHSNSVNQQRMTLTYNYLQQSDVDLIRDHYNDNQGTAGEFLVPSSVLNGISVINSNTVFRYSDTPREEHSGVYFSVTVELVAIEGIEILFALNGGPAALPAEEAVSVFVFDGTAPFILDGSNSGLATLILNGD